jgi:hypothetical protein
MATIATVLVRPNRWAMPGGWDACRALRTAIVGSLLRLSGRDRHRLDGADQLVGKRHSGPEEVCQYIGAPRDAIEAGNFHYAV